MDQSHAVKDSCKVFKHPGAIFIQLTTACNAKCINCPHPFTYGQNGYHKKGIMKEDVWNKIIQDIQTMEYRNQVGLYLHHEPLMEKNLFKKIAQINNETDAFVVISTNGSLLNESNRKALIGAKPRIVHININSAEKGQYEKMTGLSFETSFHHAKSFISEAAGKVHVEINCPVLPEVDIDKLINLFPGVQVNTEFWANSRGGLLEGITSKDRGSRFRISEYCLQPEQNFNILFDGSVIICCNDWSHESKNDFPNIMDQSIQEIYNGQTMQRIMREFRDGDYGSYPMCHHCAVEMGFIREVKNTAALSHPDMVQKPRSLTERKPLSVLLATNHLLTYSGSEITLFTIAKILKEKGHFVSIYAAYTNPRFITIFNGIASVFDDVRKLSEFNDVCKLSGKQFDVAYVQHHTIALEVRHQFPNLPMVLASLGVVPFLEQPPVVDLNICKYLAISEEVERNLIQKGIQEAAVTIFRNIVDSRKFRPTRIVNQRPRSAFIYSYKMDEKKVALVMKACKTLDIECRRIGEKPGAILQDDLPNWLNEADIVFTLGRGAIETMMCGKIPIIFDYHGGDGMVTPQNIDELMMCNFSGRLYGRQYNVEEMITEIKRYDPENASILQRKAIELFDAERGVDSLIAYLKDATMVQTGAKGFAAHEIVGTIAEIINTTKFYTVQTIRSRLATPSTKLEETPNASTVSSRFEDRKDETALSPKVFIIILTFNQLEYTKKCVKSLRKHTPEPHEIIFVDNGSTDGTVKWLRRLTQENKHYRLIENEQNLGFAKGCNQGIETSRGEFVLLLNNDVVVTEGWLSGLLDCLSHAPDAGVVGPMTNNISGPQQVAFGQYRSVNYLDKYAATFKERFRHRRIPQRRMVGFCMLFKRALVERIGMLDESFGTGNFEDDDFCLRAALAGYQNYIAGDVFVHHYGSRSFIGNGIDYNAAMSGNRKILGKKWTLSSQNEAGKKLALLKAVELAGDLYRKGKLDQAVEALVDCIKITPDAETIYFELARMFLESRKFPEAWEVIESMPNNARNALKGLECAGYAKEGLGADDEAAGYADRMLVLDERYAPALNLRGVLAYKKGEKGKAADYFKKAVDADPGYGEAYTNLGVLHWGLEKKDEAIEDIEKGFVLAPLVPDHSSIYYSTVISMGRFAEAETVLFDARGLYPNSKAIAFLYIDALIQQGKWDAAMLQIEDALISFDLDEGMLKAAISVRGHLGPRRIDQANTRGCTLSLCMIVKNEEAHLAKCLRSVRDIVDEMIVVDTGSTDKTMDIARVFGAQVFEFPWTGDFSAARNRSLAGAAGDWILILDADEVISARDLDELKKLISKRSTTPVAYSIVTRNYTRNVGVIGWTENSGQYPEEAGAGWVTSAKVRLFPKRGDIFFINPVHELVEDSLRAVKINIVPCEVVVHHYGKLDAEKESQKGEDYYLLGKIKYESDPTNVKYINELAKQAQVLNRYEEAVELWLKLGSLLEANLESTDYQEIARVSYGEPLSEIYIQLAAAYLMLDRYEEALSASRKAVATGTHPKEYVHIYAHCEIIAGSLGKAFSALEALLEATPDYAPALFMTAVIFCLQGETEKAREGFESLARSCVQLTPLLNKIARQLHAHSRKDEALLILDAAMENRLNDEETGRLLESFRENRAADSPGLGKRPVLLY